MAERFDVSSFLGRGIKFPISVDETTGRMQTSAYEEDIREAVYIILMTKPGERVRNPGFGCNIHEYAFGSTDFTTLKELERTVDEALVQWEPRIKNIDVEVSLDELDAGKLNILINYVVRATNNPFNLVFPFYINEGFGDNI